MQRNYGSNEEALSVAKRALYLAWKAASGPAGAGFLQDRGEQPEDSVWAQAYDMRDYSGRRPGTPPESVEADYVFGRMKNQAALTTKILLAIGVAAFSYAFGWTCFVVSVIG